MQRTSSILSSSPVKVIFGNSFLDEKIRNAQCKKTKNLPQSNTLYREGQPFRDQDHLTKRPPINWNLDMHFRRSGTFN